jgi:cell wall-associated NlpC family hydrolase
MPACARRAAVVLFTIVSALALVVPATDAETRVPDGNGPLPTYKITAPVTGTHLALAPGRATIKYHHTVRLASQLSSRFGPIKNETVTWWSRRPHGTWKRTASAKTNDAGRSSLKRRLTSTTQWQVRFGGDLLQNRSVSKVTTVKVLPPPQPQAGTSAFGDRVVQEAARHRGAPYQYGAAGPNTFDCSGFTMYVFGRFGISLPHNAASQYSVSRHISSASKRPGDLIFFTGSGGISHVGIYAGGGEMWAATHTGDVVRLESIYSSSYVVGRVG